MRTFEPRSAQNGSLGALPVPSAFLGQDSAFGHRSSLSEWSRVPNCGACAARGASLSGGVIEVYAAVYQRQMLTGVRGFAPVSACFESCRSCAYGIML